VIAAAMSSYADANAFPLLSIASSTLRTSGPLSGITSVEPCTLGAASDQYSRPA
jgi:hypothetical protein